MKRPPDPRELRAWRQEGFFRESGRPVTDDGPPLLHDEDEIVRTIAALV
jgi:hypothetical protein